MIFIRVSGRENNFEILLYLANIGRDEGEKLPFGSEVILNSNELIFYIVQLTA